MGVHRAPYGGLGWGKNSKLAPAQAMCVSVQGVRDEHWRQKCKLFRLCKYSCVYFVRFWCTMSNWGKVQANISQKQTLGGDLLPLAPNHQRSEQTHMCALLYCKADSIKCTVFCMPCGVHCTLCHVNCAVYAICFILCGVFWAGFRSPLKQHTSDVYSFGSPTITSKSRLQTGPNIKYLGSRA